MGCSDCGLSGGQQSGNTLLPHDAKAAPNMTKKMNLIPMLAAGMMLSGCVSTAKTVVTAPFKAAGQVVDWSTTSQEEADRNRGRAMRERDEKIGKLNKDRQKALTRCERGDQGQCQRAQILDHEIEAVMAAPF